MKYNFRNYCIISRHYSKIQEVAEFSNGKKLTLDCGRFAKLADGSAVASIGETSVLVTSVNKLKSNPFTSFVPLTVDYRQKYAAAGRIPSNYLRRELAPSDKEILTSRVIDRSIRPLFPSDFFHDTQLNCQLLAVDGLQDPDVVSINAASASLAVSNIPWCGPVGAVRVGLLRGEPVLFPNRKELSMSDMNLIVTASDNNRIVMLEGGANCVDVASVKKAIEIAVDECQKIVSCIKSLTEKVGKTKKEYNTPARPPEHVVQAVRSLSETRITDIFRDFSHSKLSRDNALNALRLDVLSKWAADGCDSAPDPSPEGKSSPSSAHVDDNIVNECFNNVVKQIFRDLILNEGLRCDGRGLSDLRPISCEVGLFPPLHGSSLFQRGQTQVQCTVAFDAPDKALRVDPLLELTGGLNDRNFLLHYSFPSFANNELSRSGAVSRREIGHGALAAKGLRPILPKANPFCTLLTSTVMESNGSSSMATVCGGSLALMDAGVAIPSHAAGVAIGLVSRAEGTDDNNTGDYKLLTDILGIEDYLGDMDFKIAGTEDGLTGLQADIKLSGVPLGVIMEAIDAGFDAKNRIIAIMNQTISKPKSRKENLPVVLSKSLPAHKRSLLMSAGALKFKRIQAESGTQMTWEDSGSLSIFGPNQNAVDEAVQLVEEGTKSEPELEFGAIYSAKIVDIRPQGVMISLYEGMTPVLLHNSQLDTRKINHPSALGLSQGEEIKVKYFGRDPNSGHMRISRRALLAISPRTRNLFPQDS